MMNKLASFALGSVTTESTPKYNWERGRKRTQQIVKGTRE